MMLRQADQGSLEESDSGIRDWKNTYKTNFHKDLLTVKIVFDFTRLKPVNKFCDQDQ